MRSTGFSKPPPYQDAERLKRATDAETRCNPRIAYDRMLQAGRFSVHYVICLFLLYCPLSGVGAGRAERLFGKIRF